MPSASSFPVSSLRRASKESEMVLQEQAENDVLVLGSVDLTAQDVGRLSEDFG